MIRFIANQKKSFKTIIQLLAIVFAINLAAPAVIIQPAAAEGFFDRLFKPFRKKKVKTKKPKVRKKKKRKSKKKKKKKTKANVVPTVEKSKNAKIILVIGDFYARALAESLKQRLAQNPNLIVKTKHKVSSGLANQEKYNWSAELPAIVEKNKPDFLITMLGINDRQNIKLDKKPIKLRSPEWDEAYQQQVKNFAEALKKLDTPFIWMGLPPVKSSKASADLLFFNDAIRIALNVSGSDNNALPYVDIWDGFADEAGLFTHSGPNVNGQLVRLRANDGINFTENGKKKLAFYADTAMQKILPVELYSSFDTTEQVEIAKPKIIIDPRTTGRTDVIFLSNESIGAEKLIGSKEDFIRLEKLARERKRPKNERERAQDKRERVADEGERAKNGLAEKNDLQGAAQTTRQNGTDRAADENLEPKGLYKPKTSVLKRADYFTQ